MMILLRYIAHLSWKSTLEIVNAIRHIVFVEYNLIIDIHLRVCVFSPEVCGTVRHIWALSLE